MAGHSKFKNIMFRKGAQDQKRAKLFAKLSREITVVARSNPDPEKNPALRAALAMARTNNMPKDRIQTAIAKASASDKKDDLTEIRYEGYGINGSAVIVEALTDNKNRTASEIRAAFSKNGGQLGETGSVSYLFDHVGSIVYQNKSADEIMEVLMEYDIKDIIEEDGQVIIISTLDAFPEVRDACLEKFGDPLEMEIVFLPQNRLSLEGEKKETFQKMLFALEDLDDTHNIFHNVE
ncbi:MAG: YebC/PmpR family DNA-binding transcriptional regulator [Alphaproteobacteria bacterium]|nr:MAG: YebC/PmpR family DNA-binding transcriptional regulator [Alphaproteobacteria bacterium]